MFSRKEILTLQEDLEAAGLEISPTKYLLLCYLASGAVGAFVAVTLYYFQLESNLLFPIALITFASTLLISKKLPAQLAASRARAMLADFPIAMRALALQLAMRIPFDVALDAIADAGYAVSPEFAKARREIKAGASVPEALRRMAARVRNTLAKRAIAAIVHAYTHGEAGEGLKKVADDIAQIHRAQFREFGAKLGFASLLFISLSCIAPMLFLAYVAVGSAFLGVHIDAKTVWIAFVVGFPAVNVALIASIALQAPCLVTEGGTKFLSKEEIEKINVLLEGKGTIGQLIALSAAAAIVIAALGLFLTKNFLFVGAIALPLLVYLVALAAVERRAKEIEATLPDALFHAALLEEGVPMEKVIATLSRQKGPLAGEFETALRQIRSGASIAHALRAMKARNASQLLARVLDLFLQCYKAGKKVGTILKETAEDILEIQSIQREQSAALALQKYTILFGGCILIPVVLAFVLQVVTSLVEIGIGAQQKDLLVIANDAIQIYLAIYVGLASTFIAMQEGRKRKAVIYFIVFCAIALALFNVTKAYVKI